MLAKAQVWMQLYRQKSAFIGLADVVLGGDATTPADKLLACAVSVGGSASAVTASRLHCQPALCSKSNWKKRPL